jgi:hypothetical protein
MQLFKILLALTAILAIACFTVAQQTLPFTISVSHWTRASSYDYRVIVEGRKQFLEMRQEGKKKWARVEDITCHGTGRVESDSFDFVGVCK